MYLYYIYIYIYINSYILYTHTETLCTLNLEQKTHQSLASPQELGKPARHGPTGKRVDSSTNVMNVLRDIQFTPLLKVFPVFGDVFQELN